MSTFHVVSLPDGSQAIYQDYQIKDGKVSVRVYTDDDDCGDSFYYEQVAVIIDKTFIVDIVAKFIMSPKDNTSMYISMGSGINHLAYNYSILIVEYYDSHTIYESSIVYSKAGIGTTDFDMYSYHRFNENNNLVYDDGIIVYEVLKHLNLDEILIKR